jgi:hypothetical protein
MAWSSMTTACRWASSLSNLAKISSATSLAGRRARGRRARGNWAAIVAGCVGAQGESQLDIALPVGAIARPLRVCMGLGRHSGHWRTHRRLWQRSRLSGLAATGAQGADLACGSAKRRDWRGAASESVAMPAPAAARWWQAGVAIRPRLVATCFVGLDARWWWARGWLSCAQPRHHQVLRATALSLAGRPCGGFAPSRPACASPSTGRRARAPALCA